MAAPAEEELIMSSALRPLFVALRAPALADRRGLRWLLSDRLWPVPVLVLKHRGRRSGRLYSTPVEAISDRRESGEVAVSPMRGKDGDWYRNIKAGNLVEVRSGGERFDASWEEMTETENRAALAGYLEAHPIYARAILRTLMRLHRLSGDPLDAVSRTLPMLRLRLTPKRTQG
jgi:deazaflavin-dependent oxidoreductase (nitroreductase family)